MNERRLLERIACREQGEERTATPRPEALVRSIEAHLVRLLNTRRGSVPMDPAFGVPDFTNVAGGAGSGSVKDMEREIARMVARYEPRLASPVVRLEDPGADPQCLRFTLEARLDPECLDLPVRLLTRVTPNGWVEVAGALATSGRGGSAPG